MEKTSTAEAIGKWIISHRPDEDTLNYLLLPLMVGVLINVALMAAFIGNLGSVGHTLGIILYVVLVIAIYGIFYEYFYDGDSFVLWELFKWFIAINLATIVYALIFGIITGIIAAGLSVIDGKYLFYPDFIGTAAATGLLIAVTVLMAYSIKWFKSDDPKKVFYAALFVSVAFITNVCLFFLMDGFPQ